MVAQMTVLHEDAIRAGFVRELCALAIPALHRYLKDQVPTHEILTPAIVVLTHATRQYEAGDYANAYGLVYAVYRAITLARTQQPDLPEVTLRPR
jgi:hypothetical protein